VDETSLAGHMSKVPDEFDGVREDGKEMARKSRPTPYSSAVRVAASADLLFLSGQLPVNEAGFITGEGVAAQLEVALRNAVALVRREGGNTKDIVRVGVFACDLSDYDALNDAYLSVLGDCRPARTLVRVAALPRGALAEVEMIVSLGSVGSVQH
jgi:2-iminobutanoate/2-iminopropanoate deaminase